MNELPANLSDLVAARVDARRPERTFDLALVRAHAARQREDSEMIVSLSDALTKAIEENQALRDQVKALSPAPAPAERKDP